VLNIVNKADYLAWSSKNDSHLITTHPSTVISIIKQIQASITCEAKWLRWVWRKCKRKANYTSTHQSTNSSSNQAIWMANIKFQTQEGSNQNKRFLNAKDHIPPESKTNQTKRQIQSNMPTPPGVENTRFHQLSLDTPQDKHRPLKQQSKSKCIWHRNKSHKSKNNHQWSQANTHSPSTIRRVYENVHRVNEYVTLQYRESKLLFSILNPPSYIWQERERERCQSLGSQRVSREILGTQDLNTHKALNLSWGLERCKIWFIKRSHLVPLKSMPWDISSKKRASVIIKIKRWEALKGST
jgi:hypothetical protein